MRGARISPLLPENYVPFGEPSIGGEGPSGGPQFRPHPSPANALICNGSDGARERGLWLRHSVARLR